VSVRGGGTAQWLLNYRYGSFLFPYTKEDEQECQVMGVSFEVIPDVMAAGIITEISSPEKNMDAVKLEKPPKIAVYTPTNKQPWDDAVTMVLKYADIPYDTIYDDKVIQGALLKYDWLHLHHEDFTGQYGRFWGGFQNAPWCFTWVSNALMRSRSR
jgi:hypothetical protein